MTSVSDEKWRLFNCFFSVQGTSGNRTGQDPEIRVGDQETGSQGSPVSSVLQVPGEPGHCRARTRIMRLKQMLLSENLRVLSAIGVLKFLDPKAVKIKT